MTLGDLPDVPLDRPIQGPPGPHRRGLMAAPAPRWSAPLYLGLSLLLIPWTVYLGFVLPDHTTAGHWDVAWVGFDVMEAVALAATAWFAYRRSTWVEVTASMSFALLAVDAWFDCTTANTMREMVQAVVLAVVIELPLAGLSLWLARHAEQANEMVTAWLVERSRRQSAEVRRSRQLLGQSSASDIDPEGSSGVHETLTK